VSIRDNRITGAFRGVLLQGAVSDTQVTGNICWNCKQAALQIEELPEECGDLLLANNTGYESHSGFRSFDYPPLKKVRQGQVEFCNNILLDTAADGDILVMKDLKDGTGAQGGDLAGVSRLWRFHDNWREAAGVASFSLLPLAPLDRRVERGFFVSLEESSADFLRPATNSPLASEGAGREDGSLPAYVGAIPPQGVERWDWDRTWRARARKAAPAQEKQKAGEAK
jgi:hypothetical protein